MRLGQGLLSVDYRRKRGDVGQHDYGACLCRADVVAQPSIERRCRLTVTGRRLSTVHNSVDQKRFVLVAASLACNCALTSLLDQMTTIHGSPKLHRVRLDDN